MTLLEYETQRLIDAGTNSLEAPALARQIVHAHDIRDQERQDRIRALRLYAQQNAQVLGGANPCPESGL